MGLSSTSQARRRNALCQHSKATPASRAIGTTSEQGPRNAATHEMIRIVTVAAGLRACTQSSCASLMCLLGIHVVARSCYAKLSISISIVEHAAIGVDPDHWLVTAGYSANESLLDLVNIEPCDIQRRTRGDEDWRLLEFPQFGRDQPIRRACVLCRSIRRRACDLHTSSGASNLSMNS